MQQERITIVCGHYGSGKTNLSVNLAIQTANEGWKTAVADLDIVNPYFRTADFKMLFQSHGIEMIAPRFANTNLDVPVLPPRLSTAIDQQDLHLIIDVGGDDDGAVALGGYAHKLQKEAFQMLYVVNLCRYLEADLEEELHLMSSVERCSRLKLTHLVNNTNLGRETTKEIIARSQGFLEALSKKSGLPILYTAAEEKLCQGLTSPGLLPIKIYVKTPWES